MICYNCGVHLVPPRKREREYPADQLSIREAEVCYHVIRGLSNKEISDRLFVTEKTIKYHMTSIYKKLGSMNRKTLMVAWHDGTLNPDSIILVHQFFPKPLVAEPVPVVEEEVPDLPYSEV